MEVKKQLIKSSEYLQKHQNSIKISDKNERNIEFDKNWKFVKTTVNPEKTYNPICFKIYYHKLQKAVCIQAQGENVENSNIYVIEGLPHQIVIRNICKVFKLYLNTKEAGFVKIV